MPLTTVPPARPAGARPARRIATAAAAATLTAGLLLGLSSPAQADPDCINAIGGLAAAFAAANATPSTATFCSTGLTVQVYADSAAGGLTLTEGNKLVIDLNGGTLDVKGGNGIAAGEDDGSDGDPGISLSTGATLVIINGTVIVTGGNGGAGPYAETAGGDGAPGILVEEGATLVITAALSGDSAGGHGGDGDYYGVGGDGAPGIEPGNGTLYVSAEGLDTLGADGTGTDGGTGGHGAPVIGSEPKISATGCTGANPEKLWLYDSDYYNRNFGDIFTAFDSFVSSGWWLIAGSGYTFDHWQAEKDEPGNWISVTGEEEYSLEDVLAFRAQCQSVQTSSSLPPAPPPSETTTPAPGTSTPTSTPTHTTSTPSSAPLPANLDSANLHLSDHQLPAGSGVTITAYGFAPGSRVHFWIHSTPQYLGSSIAAANGIATLRVTLDPSLVGLHHIQAVGIGPHGKTRNLAQPITLTTKALVGCRV